MSDVKNGQLDFSGKANHEVVGIFLDRSRDTDSRFQAFVSLLQRDKTLAYRVCYQIAADRHDSDSCRISALVFLDRAGIGDELIEGIVLNPAESWYVRQTLLLGFCKPDKVQQLVGKIDHNANEDPAFRNMTIGLAFGAMANGKVFKSDRGLA